MRRSREVCVCKTREPVRLDSPQVYSRDGEVRSLCPKPRPGFSMQILAGSPRRAAGGQCLAEAPWSWQVGRGGLPPARHSLPPHVQGPSRTLGRSYLLPVDCSHGTKWAPGLGGPWGPGWGSSLLMLISGAGARGVPWARAPRPLAAHSPQAQRKAFTAACKPRAPQTGLA